MSKLKFVVPALILTAGFAVTTMTSYAKPEYSKKEKKGCTYCHIMQGKKELNDVGKCYGENEHSLATCAPAAKKS